MISIVKPAIALFLYLVFSCFAGGSSIASLESKIILFPADKSIHVNPDTHFKLTFPNPPDLGNAGRIRIYDASDNRLVDLLDLIIPAGPTTSSTSSSATYTPVPYEYTSGHFTNANTKKLVVSDDGTGDFNTVQGAIDSIPDYNPRPIAIFIKNGMYEERVTIAGSGDALQSNGPAYFDDCRIVGDGDTILGRGPAFFNHCELSSHGPYMWIRNTLASHGFVFVNCKFQTRGNQDKIIARSTTNGGKNYPYCEAVLIQCALAGIAPTGWGEIGGDTSNVHYWEYGSANLSDGKPIDAGRRHPVSRQLTLEKDAEIIVNSQNPTYVLGGWDPK
jgi:hypothetical protein